LKLKEIRKKRDNSSARMSGAECAAGAAINDYDGASAWEEEMREHGYTQEEIEEMRAWPQSRRGKEIRGRWRERESERQSRAERAGNAGAGRENDVERLFIM